jgi:hypothetical protein
MAVAIELRKPGRDGKVRLLHPRDQRERWRLIHLAHQSRCELGLSYRQVRARLEQYGAAVSLGQVHNWVKDFECDICAGQADEPAQDEPAGPAHFHQAPASGSLMGMITDA